MSKTRPVRWWRDDATRYQSRAPYKAPPVEGPHFEMPPPEIVAALADYQREIEEHAARLAQWEQPQDNDPIQDVCRALGVPPEILGRPPSHH